MIDTNDSSLDILQEIETFIDNGRNFAVALVLKSEGSTPRKAGVRAIIDNSGKIHGTIGGGAVEAETQSRAVESCKSKKPVIFDVELHGADREDNDPICGGRMRILIDPTAVQHKVIFNKVAEAIKQREKGIMLTSISHMRDLQVDYQWYQQESVPTDIQFPGQKEILSCLEHERPQLFRKNLQDTATTKEIFVEPVIPGPLLVIAGGGHIGQSLAIQAELVGFDIVVLDDRSEFTNPELFPKNTTTLCGDIAQQLAQIPAQKDTYIVIVTRGHKNDAEALEVCIKKPFDYIGMIGSKRKISLIRENFIQSGLSTAEQFDKVFTPIGLGIGALTVPEIATSITAELIAVRRTGLVHKSFNNSEPL